MSESASLCGIMEASFRLNLLARAERADTPSVRSDHILVPLDVAPTCVRPRDIAISGRITARAPAASGNILDALSVVPWSRPATVARSVLEIVVQGSGTVVEVDTSECGDRCTVSSHGPTDSTRSPVRLTGGRDHFCAYRQHGEMVCWGWNAHGQLGLGDTFTRGSVPHMAAIVLPPVRLWGGHGVSMASCGHHTTCVLLDVGAVVCFGDNGRGQLGLGHTSSVGTQEAHMGDALQEVASLHPFGAVTAVSTGKHFVCALTASGKVVCWGANDMGQLGINSDEDMLDEPDEIGGLVAVDLGADAVATSVVAGPGSHTCAILEGGSLKCWCIDLLSQSRSASDTVASHHLVSRSLTRYLIGWRILRYKCIWS